MAEDETTMTQLLAQHRFFQECLLNELRLCRFGTGLDLEFEYIWDDDKPGSIVTASSRTVILALDLVFEVHITATLPDAIVSEPEYADWGLTEVAIVRLIPESDFLTDHRRSDVQLFHLAVEWEGDRRIDAIFARMQIGEDGGTKCSGDRGNHAS